MLSLRWLKYAVYWRLYIFRGWPALIRLNTIPLRTLSIGIVATILLCDVGFAQCTYVDPRASTSGYEAWCRCVGGTPYNNGGNVACHPPSSAGYGTTNTAVANAVEQGLHPIGEALGRWLGNLLFGGGSDSQADLQRRQMMEELARRQAEAERQHREEDARRLAEMYNRLASVLKLRGLPDLELKQRERDQPALAMKLRGSEGIAGSQGLPGIYLNDKDKPYGIPGLPGIYTGGPADGSGLKLKTRESEAAEAASTGSVADAGNSAQASSTDASNALAAIATTETGLRLKTRDSNSAPDSMAAGSTTNQSQAANLAPDKMTPQQMADAAEAFSKLPPEEQQRLLSSAAVNLTNQQNGKLGNVDPDHPNPKIEDDKNLANAINAAKTDEQASELARRQFDSATSVSPVLPSQKSTNPAQGPSAAGISLSSENSSTPKTNDATAVSTLTNAERTALSGTNLSGGPIVNCKGAQAKYDRLMAGVPVQQEAVKRTERLFESLRQESRLAPEEAARKRREYAYDQLLEASQEIVEEDEKLVKALSPGTASGELMEEIVLETKAIGAINDSLQSLQAGIAYGSDVQKKTYSLGGHLVRLCKILADSGIAEQAGGKILGVYLGPTGPLAFKGLVFLVDASIDIGRSIDLQQKIQQAGENLNTMRLEYDRIQVKLESLRTDCLASSGAGDRN